MGLTKIKINNFNPTPSIDGYTLRLGRVLLLWLGFFLFMSAVILFCASSAFAQNVLAPFRTQQINTNYYVGQSNLDTIQKAVTAACASTAGGRVMIQAGTTPPDTIGSVTGGCGKAPIVDERGLPSACYMSSGGAYIVANCGSGSGSSIPGTIHQQIFSAGGGAATASNATLDVAGNGVFKSYGGTPDAFLNQTNPSTGTNDGIRNSLQTVGNLVTVNQGYPAVELPSNSNNVRAPVFVTGFFFGNPAPPFAYNTIFDDKRSNNVGVTYYNPFSVSHPPMVHNKLVKDDDEFGSNSQATNYGPLVDDVVHWCCGVPQNGNQQSAYNTHTQTVLDNTWGIKGHDTLLMNCNGVGDCHAHQTLLQVNGGSTNFSDEAGAIYRDQADQSAVPFFGTVPALAKGTAVIPVTPGSSSNAPGEGRIAIDVTQQGAQFHILSTNSPNFPNPGIWNTDTTFTRDTFCQFGFSTSGNGPPLTKGQTTPTTMAIGNCSAAITTTDSICIASATGLQQVKVTSAGPLDGGGGQTIVANLEKPLQGTELISQGPNACKVVEVLANRTASSTAQPYRDLVRILGNAPWIGPSQLFYVSMGPGNWLPGPNGNYSSLSIGAGATLTRDGSGNVSVTIGNDFGHSFPGTVLHVIATDPSYSGTFTIATETGQVPATITWSNPGTAGSTTLSATSYFVASNGFDDAAAVMGPGALVMQANNPATRSADGTIVLEAGNNITFAANDVIASSAQENNPMTMHHESITYVGPSSPSEGEGMNTEMEIINPCAGCAFQRVGLTGNTHDYSGGGGFRSGPVARDLTGGQALWSGYDVFQAPQGGGVLRHVVGCGLRACTDPGAFYAPDQFDGSSGNYKSTWNISSNNMHTNVHDSTLGDTATDQQPRLYQVTINDNAGNSNILAVGPTSTGIGRKLTVTDNTAINPITSISNMPAGSCTDALSSSSSVEWGICVGGSSGLAAANGTIPIGGAGVYDKTNNKLIYTATDSLITDDVAHALRSGSTMNGTEIPQTATPVLNKAVCYKSISPIVLGSCSTAVDATGACTCI